MKIYCEIPDDITQIFKEFLQISDQSDGDMAEYMIFFLEEAARHKLSKQWDEIEKEIEEKPSQRKEEEQEEIADKILKLSFFGSEWIRIMCKEHTEEKEANLAKRKEIGEVKRRWQDAFKDDGSCAATRGKA